MLLLPLVATRAALSTPTALAADLLLLGLLVDASVILLELGRWVWVLLELVVTPAAAVCHPTANMPWLACVCVVGQLNDCVPTL